MNNENKNKQKNNNYYTLIIMENLTTVMQILTS